MVQIFSKKPIPADVGIGLKPQHYHTILETLPDIAWFEIHPENYMGQGGLPHHYLTEIRKHYPLSFHSVGLSLGSADSVTENSLKLLKELINRYQPGLISEHLSWSQTDGTFLNDLLPLPYTEENLTIICRNIDTVQSYLNHNILIENPSTYIEFKNSEFSEVEFLTAIAKKTGCKILLDVNNVYVCAWNHNFDAKQYIDSIPSALVHEIHLAGHTLRETDSLSLRIDDHGSPVCDDVWQLYQRASKRFPNAPTLLEWDNNIPELSVLLNEAKQAKQISQAIRKNELAHDL